MSDLEVDHKEIQLDHVQKWQNIVDNLADIMGVADALITRVDHPYLEVFKSSNNQDNIFHESYRVELTGHYCEEVIRNDKKIIISNALQEVKWKNYPEAKNGLISYLGLPLKWPDNSIFGTLCVHDTKENNFSQKLQILMDQFKELIESHLKIIYQNEEVIKTSDKYKTIFNKAPIGIFKTTSKGKVSSINPTMAKMLGCSSVAEALEYYQNISQDLYINPERREEFIYRLENKAEVKSFEYEAVQINGSRIWISMNARISKRFKDGSYEIDGFAFDITESKLAEERLRKQREELQIAYEQLTAYSQEVTAMNEELDESMQEIRNYNKRFTNMINIVSNLDESYRNDDKSFLSYLLKSAISIVPEADYGMIVTFENENCDFIDSVGHDVLLLRRCELKKEIFINNSNSDVYTSAEYPIKFDYLSSKEKIFSKALKPISRSIYINITIRNNVVGRINLDIAAGSNKDFTKNTKQLLISFATLASSFFSFQQYSKLQKGFNKELITSTTKLLEIYDGYTSGHSENVANLAIKIAETMGLSKKAIEDTYWTGMLHDVGKLLIPLEILNKKGPLTEEEYELVKNHPVWGYLTLSKSDTLGHIGKYILHHHERWDGTGYPDNLCGDEIPLVSQILSLADSWDAMTSNRAYRDALPKEAALKEIRNNRGKQFMPEVTDVFLKMIDSWQ